jgi:hypothetical protein
MLGPQWGALITDGLHYATRHVPDAIKATGYALVKLQPSSSRDATLQITPRPVYEACFR